MIKYPKALAKNPKIFCKRKLEEWNILKQFLEEMKFSDSSYSYREVKIILLTNAQHQKSHDHTQNKEM